MTQGARTDGVAAGANGGAGATAPDDERARRRRGILWMLVTTFFWVGSDTIVKTLSADYDTPQILWARYTFHLVFVLAILNRRLPSAARSHRPGLQIVRSAVTLFSTGLFFLALASVPIAEANAVFAIAPVAVTVLSVPLLGETVGPRRWAAVAVGFAGALVIIRPGFGAMAPAIGLVVVSALLNAFYQILTRRLGGIDPVPTTVLFTPLAGVVAATCAAPFFWSAPDLGGWVLMTLLGASSGAGHASLVKALEAAPASVVTPFGYTSLLWATLFGFLVFGHLPDTFTVLGALLIVGGGLYILHRESRLARRAARARASDKG